MAKIFYIRKRAIKESHYDPETFGMKDFSTIYKEKEDRERVEKFLIEMLNVKAQAQMTKIREYIVDLRDDKSTNTLQGLSMTLELCKREYDEYADHLSETHGQISQFQIDRIWKTQLEQLRKMMRTRQ